MVSTPPWCYLTNKLAKIRVVFDVNVDCKGRCINRKLLSGPDLTNKIAGVLLRFGEEQVLVIGEISGIDSWVQPRLNLGFTWILKPTNLDEPSEQVAQVRARFQNPPYSAQLGSLEQIKSQVLDGFAGSLPKQQYPQSWVYIGSRTQLTQVSWVLEPSLARFIKTLKGRFQLGFPGFAAKTIKPRELGLLGSRTQLTKLSWVH